MKYRCSITYELSDTRYSPAGLRLIDKKLNDLRDFQYSAEEQRAESAARAAKMSIQGVQPKISTRFSLRERTFKIVDLNGNYIFKPQNNLYSYLPENEDLTMKLAGITGINTPFHGLLYCKDGSLTYFIKRFDRMGKNRKIAVEDFAQLTGRTRETKYDSSMEKVAEVIEKYCTFPVLDKIKLFQLAVFNFITGNEDMHLKNYSLISVNGRTGLSPSYDLINTTIAVINAEEESALPVGGKKKNLNHNTFFKYYGNERLGLNEKILEIIKTNFGKIISSYYNLIEISFLPDDLKEKYTLLVKARAGIIGLL